MLDRIKKDFSTLTLALIPIAILINISIGQIVGFLKLPVYLDSIGTILVAVLAGPIPGAVTGALANFLWGIVIGNPVQTWPFAITAFVIGLVSGLFAQWGWFRREFSTAVGAALVVAVGLVLIAIQVINGPDPTTRIIGASISAGLTLMALVLTLMRVFPPLVAVGGVLTGIISAIVSAPIVSAMGGITGSGTDWMVALFEASGANIQQAVLGQSITSDPFDKFVSFVVVWFILHSLAARYLVRFPHGANLLEAK